MATKMNAYANIIASLNSDLTAIATEVERLKGLKTSKENTIDSMKKVLINVLQLCGTTGKTGNKSFATELHKFYTVLHKPVVITDERLIPDTMFDYQFVNKYNNDEMRIIADALADTTVSATFTEVLNKTRLKGAIKDGESVLGAYIDDKASYIVIK
jgi:hypothetical protein